MFNFPRHKYQAAKGIHIHNTVCVYARVLPVTCVFSSVKSQSVQPGLECIQTQLPKLRFVSPSPGTMDCQIPLLNLCLVLFDVVAVQFLYCIWNELSVRRKPIADTILNSTPPRHPVVSWRLAYVTETGTC